MRMKLPPPTPPKDRASPNPSKGGAYEEADAFEGLLISRVWIYYVRNTIQQVPKPKKLKLVTTQ